jgi:PAS domain S-box-containing protein
MKSRISRQPKSDRKRKVKSVPARKRTQTKSRPSRDQLEAIMRGIAEGITVQEPDGKLIYANQAAAHLLGFLSPEDLIQTPVNQVLDRFEVKDELGNTFPTGRLPGRLALQGQQTSEQVLRFRIKATGEERWSAVQATPALGQDGQVQFAVNMFRDVTDRTRADLAIAEQRKYQRFLAEASELLGSSLDYETTLRNVAQLAVPEFADWCAVHIVRQDGSIDQIALAHQDPAKLDLGYELQRNYPPPEDAATGLRNVLRTGKSEMMSEIPDGLLVAAARDEEHLRLMHEIGIKSYMIVPLIARGHTLGGMSFVSGISNRPFTGGDLAFAEILASRAANAIDNARLYQQTQKLNEELELRVIDRTSELMDEIQERRQAEEELSQQKDLYDVLLKAQSDLGDGVALTEGMRIVYANEALGRIYGHSVDELLKLPSLLDLVAPEERLRLTTRLRDRLSGANLDAKGETAIIHKDGHRIDIEYAVKTLPVGGRDRLFAIIRDITERKKTTEALQASEEKFKGLLESAPDAIVIVDGEGQIRIVNSQTEKLFGYARDELLGKSIEMLMPDRFRGRHVAHRMDYFLTPQVRVMGAGLELYGLHKDQREFPVDISLSPLKTEDGILVSAAVRDITERQRAQLDLQASYTQLRALASRLEAVREEERTRIARELHDELGQALTALKIDLSSLAGRLPKRNDTLRAGAQAMSDEIDATIKTVRRISTELRPGMLDDLGLAAAIEWQGQEFAARMGIECQVRLPDHDLVPNREQATAIFRIFQETLTNVARHADATKVDVTLESVGDTIRLLVHDNGRGFDRAQVTAKHSLGLLGMQERAETLGGSLEVESAFGQGTIVTAVMPLGGPPRANSG